VCLNFPSKNVEKHRKTSKKAENDRKISDSVGTNRAASRSNEEFKSPTILSTSKKAAQEEDSPTMSDVQYNDLGSLQDSVIKPQPIRSFEPPMTMQAMQPVGQKQR
jgi:hypothetical protein